jgi:hypothetical protein
MSSLAGNDQNPANGSGTASSIRRVRLLRPTDRHPILYDHYRPDGRPGLPSYDPAQDNHDFFNLIVLVPVVVLNLMNWNFDVLWSLSRERNTHNSNNSNNANQENDGIAMAWTDDWFAPFFYVTTLYFLVDLTWILCSPSCVKSPATIVQHHLATLMYLLIPYMYEKCHWCMGACLIVEVNTWFLIARRVFNKQGFSPWIIDLSFFSIRVKLISILFYTTWILIRCLWYPYLMIPFYRIWLRHSHQVNTKINLVMLTLPLHFAFCCLNLKWSYDLLMSKIRYWRRKGRGAKEPNNKGL